MTHRDRVMRGSVSSEHVVQLFDTSESRTRHVSAFLREGLRHGDTLLVVAKTSHWALVATDLAHHGYDIDEAVAAGQIVVKDAAVMLGSFLRHGRPDTHLFEETVATLVSSLAQRGQPLRVYGEIVDLLAEEGNLAAAESLEHLWNDLAARHSFLLLCGYCSAHFGPETTASALRAICNAHTRVASHASDVLASWLVTGEAQAVKGAWDN